MFTGIVETLGAITKIEERSRASALFIQAPFRDLRLGESISVDGACLTVARLAEDGFWCDVSGETLSKTIAGGYREGIRVNLERALRLGDRLGGHWVTGHVDGTGKVLFRQNAGECVLFKIAVPEIENANAYLLSKGSICVNGVSLTINATTDLTVELMLIPHTLALTTMSQLEPGGTVNIEFDWMAKLCANALNHKTGLGMDL